MPKVPAALLLPLGIGVVLSGLMTWINLGLVDGFLWRWFTSFISALPVMALGFVLMQAYDRLVQRRLATATDTQRKLVLALLMAVTLELLMSSVVTLRNVGWGGEFGSAWVNAFTRSLPMGLAMGLLMGFVIKPWLQRRTETARTDARTDATTAATSTQTPIKTGS